MMYRAGEEVGWILRWMCGVRKYARLNYTKTSNDVSGRGRGWMDIEMDVWSQKVGRNKERKNCN